MYTEMHRLSRSQVPLVGLVGSHNDENRQNMPVISAENLSKEHAVKSVISMSHLAPFERENWLVWEALVILVGCLSRKLLPLYWNSTV